MCSNPEFTEIHWQADHWRGRRADSYHSTECRSLCRCRDGPSCRDCTPSYARRCGERAGQGRSVKTYLKRVTVPSGCCLSSQPVQKVFNRWWQRFAENHFNVMAVTTATPTRGCIGLNCLRASSPIGDRRHPIDAAGYVHRTATVQSNAGPRLARSGLCVMTRFCLPGMTLRPISGQVMTVPMLGNLAAQLLSACSRGPGAARRPRGGLQFRR